MRAEPSPLHSQLCPQNHAQNDIRINNYTFFGNFFHAVNILNTIIYVTTVIIFASSSTTISSGISSISNGTSILDSEWLKDGFCVTNKEMPYWTTHDLCLYADTILSIILVIIYLALRNTPGMEAANNYLIWNIPSILGHGFAHGGFAKVIRDGSNSDEEDRLTRLLGGDPKDILIFFILPTLIFWAPLLKAVMNNMKLQKIIPFAFIASAAGIPLPRQFDFVYVQTVVSLAFSANELSRPKGDKTTFEYALFSFFIIFPGLIAWVECTLCSNSAMEMLGGHLIFDASIALMAGVGYLLSWLMLDIEKMKSL